MSQFALRDYDMICYGCFYKFGVLFVGVLVINTLPLRVYIRATDFGNSQMLPETELHLSL